MFPDSENAWHRLSDEITQKVNCKISESLKASKLPIETIHSPLQAHWFLLDSLSIANQANRDGMHANALMSLRQCIEAISLVEIGLSGHPDASQMLLRWQSNKRSAGQLRKWLQENVWSRYGSGLWQEPWSTFFANLAGAVQAYAHYSGPLAQWQSKLVGMPDRNNRTEMIIEIGPRLYDPQKATRITLYHVLLTYTLGRIWIANNPMQDKEFNSLLAKLGKSLGKSQFLDGHPTDWSQQFWSTLLFDGKPIPK